MSEAPKEREKETGHRSSWSFRILSVSGIPIRIHFTFLLFLVWIAVTSRTQLSWAALVVAIFGCVLLHELGHALVARKYGIGTRDITLYPIGGVAMLDGRPAARAELWIALAGPAVNVVIAAVLAAFLAVSGQLRVVSPEQLPTSFLASLMAANVSLVLFNLVPAFPMDGGRILRALLAMRMGDARATMIAAAIGQGLAVVFGLIALLVLREPVLMLIAFFVFLGAGQEANQSMTRSFLAGHGVKDAMQRRFRTIAHGANLEVAAEMLLAGSQRDFPVLSGEEIVGILARDDIARGLATAGPTAYVAGFMRRDFKTAHPNLPLERVAEMFGAGDDSPVLVMEGEILVGMLTQENLSEFIMLEHARQQARNVQFPS